MLLLVLLVAVEGLLRVYDYQNPNCFFLDSDVFADLDQDLKRSICLDNDNLRWSYDPYLQPEPNQHYATINTNQDGFRGKEISLEKPLDTFRVFVVGGSTVFGVGSSSDSTTIPAYLQKQYDFKQIMICTFSYVFVTSQRKKNNKIKNKAPNINPPGICPKAMGSALKTRSGPSFG